MTQPRKRRRPRRPFWKDERVGPFEARTLFAFFAVVMAASVVAVAGVVLLFERQQNQRHTDRVRDQNGNTCRLAGLAQLDITIITRGGPMNADTRKLIRQLQSDYVHPAATIDCSTILPDIQVGTAAHRPTATSTPTATADGRTPITRTASSTPQPPRPRTSASTPTQTPTAAPSATTTASPPSPTRTTAPPGTTTPTATTGIVPAVVCTLLGCPPAPAPATGEATP